MYWILHGALRAWFLMRSSAVSEVSTSMSRILSNRRDPGMMCAQLTGKMRENVHDESGVGKIC